MNTNLITQSWNNYKKLFFSSDSPYDEKYKWEALKMVSERWNWNVANKAEMFKNAFDIKGPNNNLWTSMNYYPVGMALRFFQDFPKETEEIFNNLFDEEQDLLSRLKSFRVYFNEYLKVMQAKYPEDKLNYHSQEIRSMSLYLFLQYPEKYVMYKYTAVKKFAAKYGFPEIKQGHYENYLIYLEIVNSLKDIIAADIDFISKYRNYLQEKNLYRDESLHLLIQDFMYCMVQYEPEEEVQYWLYSPGEQARKWDQFSEEGIMALGWDELDDLNSYENRGEILAALKEKYGGDGDKKNDVTANDEFLSKIRLGDIIIAKKGMKELIGYGKVTSDYYYEPDATEYRHRRKVYWQKKGLWNVGSKSLVIKALTNITQYNTDVLPGKKYGEYLVGLIEGTIYPEEIPMSNEADILTYKKQIILYGPPGTGKTRKAKMIAREMLGMESGTDLKNSNRFKLIQFHPSYSYEDFVRGIVAKPSEEGEGILYEAENKILGELAAEAQKNHEAARKSLQKITDISEVLERFKEHIISKIDAEEKYQLTDHIYIFYADENRFKYKGDNWNRHPKGLNIPFSEFNKVIALEPKDRQDIVQHTALRALTRSHATYFYQLFQKYQEFYASKKHLFGQKIEEKNYVLVIDEINRANLSAVLGELIYALEYRGEKVESMYDVGGKEIVLPPNLYIIGTMNTADRSIGHIDYAIRRRFSFIEMLPEILEDNDEIYFNEVAFREVMKLFIKPNADGYFSFEDGERSDELSGDFSAKDVVPGHSYFIAQKAKVAESEKDRHFALKMKYEVIPILKEYVKDGVLYENALARIKMLEKNFC